MINYQDLGKLAFFEALSEAQLKWVAENSSELTFQAGEKLIHQGEPGEALWFLLEGEWRLTRRMGGVESILTTTTQPGTWVGGYTLVQGVNQVTVTVLSPARVLYIHNEAVKKMLVQGFPIALHIINGLISITRIFEMQVSQHEKMASLGKLAAGLAHELNNPAAAGRRAASQLAEVMAGQQEITLAFCRSLDPSHVEWLKTFLGEIRLRTNPVVSQGGLEQSEREDELAGWLEEQGVSEAWNLAPGLLEAGFELDWLEKLKENLGPERLEPSIRWIESDLRIKKLLNQLEQSTVRISTLVKTVKNYSFMDQAPRQEIDLHDGLENTLLILNHKIGAGVGIKREYDKSLPRITAYGSELNQVWTNLLDNALDALDGQGQLVIRTWHENQPERVAVEIIDDGPGIPPEIKARIFEPFFTTKEVGKGTGLGLDIAYRIIVTHHKGEINVTSRPGQTCFQVFLPVRVN